MSLCDEDNSKFSLNSECGEDDDALTILRKDFGINNLADSTDSDSNDEAELKRSFDSDSEDCEVNSPQEGDVRDKLKNSFTEKCRPKRLKLQQSVDESVLGNVSIETEQLMVDDFEDKEEHNVSDPFIKHLHYELHPNLLKALSESTVSTKIVMKSWQILGKLSVRYPTFDEILKESPKLLDANITYAVGGKETKLLKSLSMMHIKPQIKETMKKCNPSLSEQNQELILTPFQNELFSIMNNYQDLFYPKRTYENGADIIYTYCLHVVNHMLKTRSKIIHHNSKLSNKVDVPDEYRDQGLIRPKVLILVPFMNSAYKVINILTSMLFNGNDGNIQHHKRFLDEYSESEKVFPRRNPKPKDYELTFEGNSNDDFKIGIAITKKSVKLYVDFYSADIIVASPLGLRRIMGAADEPEQNYDFLASIELLILDQTEIFLMQNWEHVIHIFEHLHLIPKNSHGTDFSRVRIWSLEGHAKFYRQTLMFSSVCLPQIISLFNKKCCNYEGNVRIEDFVKEGSISRVFVIASHRFYKFNAGNPVESLDQRFGFFLREILPDHKDAHMKKTLIFIPDYCDYVRLRNHFMKESLSFTQICEYSKPGKVARARDMFCNGNVHFMLYSGRYHFYNRIRIKGIRHIIFYGPPTFPQFYSEICNLIQKASYSSPNVSTIYCKYDVFQLAAIVGTEKAQQMLKSEKNIHMLLTEGL